MSKLDTARKLFEIGKLAAETYNTFSDGRKKQREIEQKDRRIAELEKEVDELRERLGEEPKKKDADVAEEDDADEEE